MKKQYKQREPEMIYSRWLGGPIWSTHGVGRYEHRHGGYHRYIQTFNEIRKNHHAVLDGYHVRGKRRYGSLPTCNDDFMIGRNWKRSWKDFTKYKKQYMKNRK